MKQFNFKEFFEFLFPEDTTKVIALIIIVILLILSIVITFVVVKHTKKNIIEQEPQQKVVPKIEDMDLIEPEYFIEENYDFNLIINQKGKPELSDFENLLKYHEFSDFTDYFLNLQFYEKKVNEFLKND
ncbi:MAG: hypothetical protein NUV32_01705 [Exilispira sp.]|jgi:hypothetical protein|nr:hypothetical protein [Exilispira sp.]